MIANMHIRSKQLPSGQPGSYPSQRTAPPSKNMNGRKQAREVS